MPSRPSSPRRPLPIIAIAVVAFTAIVVAFAASRPAAPPPVATGTVSPVASGSDGGSGGDGGSAQGGLDGTWTIDPALGSPADWSGSFVGYRVQEELATLGTVTVVGRTPDVSGSLVLAGSTIERAEFTADLTTLRSDDSRRDGQVGRQGLETNAHPTGTFVLAEPIALATLPGDGASVTADAVGDLTLHGVTRRVTILLTGTLRGNEILVAGALPIRWEEFGMTKPTAAIVLSLADELTIELQLRFRRD